MKNVILATSVFAVLVGCGSRQQPQTSEEQPPQNQQQADQTARKAEQQAQQAERQANQAAQTARRAQQQATNERRPARRPEPRTDQAEETQPRQGGRNAAAELPAGAVLSVRIDQPLDTSKNKGGDTFTATLDQPVVVDGRTVLPRGTRFNGSVTTAESSGRLSGQGVLTVKLDSFELNGKTYKIDSTTVSRITGGHTKRDIGIIGGAGAAGAAIGGVVGGGKGAAIGAGAGAAAGTAGAAATGRQDVHIPAETEMVFTLQNAVKL